MELSELEHRHLDMGFWVLWVMSYEDFRVTIVSLINNTVLSSPEEPLLNGYY